MDLLSLDQWRALRNLYAAGKRGIPHDGVGYRAAGPWSVLVTLRDSDPPLAREIFRPNPVTQQLEYFFVITDAGDDFYEVNERFYQAFYPEL